jgi:hypothetical protein
MISRRVAIDMRKKGETLEAVAVCAGIAVDLLECRIVPLLAKGDPIPRTGSWQRDWRLHFTKG